MDSTNTLSQIVVSQAYKEVTANELFAAMSSAAAYGRNADTCGGLTFGYYGARYGGASVANGTNTCGASTTTYMVADRATGAVSFSTSATNWSDVLNYGRCFKIVTGTATVTSYEDHRSGPMGAHAQSSFSGIDIYTKNPDTTTGLTWGYLGGLYNGNTIANGTVTLTNTADNYVVVLRSTGVVSTSTTSTNSVDPLYAKLCKLTCAGSVVTVAVDQRTDANGLLFGAPASASDVAAATHAATSKTTPVDADELPLTDSAASYALKKLTFTNLKAFLKTYFDTLYALVGAVGSTGITMSTARLLGRTTASSGAVEEISIGSGLSMSAGTLSATGGGSGTVTSVDASGGVQTASGSAITGTGTVRGAHVINAQVGTTYAVVSGDRGKHLTLSNAASIAATIAQAGTTGFEDGYFVYIEAIGVGAVTLTPATSTVNGAATLVLDSGMSAVLFSDGTNYRAIVIDAAGVAVNAQTGTSYTYLSGDRGKLVTHTNASAIAGTLPQAIGAFGSTWFMWVQNRGVGTLTITPTTSTIDGSATLALTTAQGVLIASNGTDYFTMRGVGSAGGASTPNNIVNGRLTLTTGSPIPTDVSGATTIYWTPYLGSQITLWDGSAWTTYTFTETSLALGTLTSGKNYDVFGYQSGGTLTLELLAWMSDTVRATAIALQDGRYCKSGDKTRLYLGTIRTTSTTTTEDTGGGTTTQVGAKRFVWNFHNRVRRPMRVHDTTSSWSYTTNTWRQANAAAGNKCEYVNGGTNDSLIQGALLGAAYLNSNTRTAMVSAGVSSTGSPSKFIGIGYNGVATAGWFPMSAPYADTPNAGYGYIAWLENGADGTCSFGGTNSSTSQTGLSLSYDC
jgi:hypothetical protein